jgi:hypothetical protein
MGSSRQRSPGLVFRIVVSSVIVFYIAAQALWMMPSTRFRDLLFNPISPFLSYTGLWQIFAVFSPDPRSTNIYLSAVVTGADGSARYVEYPRQNRLDLWDRIRKERFRKFGLDNLYWDAHRVLWEDAARYVARQFRERSPVMVSLQRHWHNIPSPEQGLGKPLPDAFETSTFFVYQVKPEDLK